MALPGIIVLKKEEPLLHLSDYYYFLKAHWSHTESWIKYTLFMSRPYYFTDRSLIIWRLGRREK